MTFRQELAGVLNSHSKENGSNTPDFILAEYLKDCLEAWDKASQRREQWYGRALEINEGDASWLDPIEANT